MAGAARPSGILAAILTPVDAGLAPDHARLIAHARWLLANGCDGLNVLGTTGEAASFSSAQRIALMEALAAAVCRSSAMLVGTGAAALDDAVTLTGRRSRSASAGALVIPPFYYKDVSEDGLFAFYAALVERTGSDALRLYLYNFPKMSGVPDHAGDSPAVYAQTFGATMPVSKTVRETWRMPRRCIAPIRRSTSFRVPKRSSRKAAAPDTPAASPPPQT